MFSLHYLALLGLLSYCLVIYYQNYRSHSSDTVTVLSNDIAVALICYNWIYDYLWKMKYLFNG
jgi:hypothetical protein